jgi:uncharacterized membrane protein
MNETQNSPMKNSMMTKIRENLLLGILALAPLTLTFWVLFSIINSIDSMVLGLLPESFAPHNLFGFNIPGIGMLVTLILLLAAGTAARTFLGSLVEDISEKVLMRIPFVGGLYKTAKQVSTVFFSSGADQAFQKVVYIPFPQAPAKAIAFVTGHPDPNHTAVFVPTAPNPTSGYVLVYPNSFVEEAPISVEEALKIVLSCGAVPAEKPGRSPKNHGAQSSL